MSTAPMTLAWPATLELPRLHLRPPKRGDAAAVNAAVLSSLPELSPYMDWAAAPPSLAESEAFCATGAERVRSGEGFPLLMFDRETGDLLGGHGLAAADLNVPSFEIGYWCMTSRSGQGLVSEATAGLTRYLFEHCGGVRVMLRIDDLNERSIRLAEGLGFELEGLLRADARRPNGKLRDTRIYARLNASGLPPIKVSATG